jgi:hypothetical protein
MSDHADIVRKGLPPWARFVEMAGTDQAKALAALDALVAERDEARRELRNLRELTVICAAEACDDACERHQPGCDGSCTHLAGHINACNRRAALAASAEDSEA